MSVYIRPSLPDAAVQEYESARGFRVDRKGRLIVWGARSETLATWAPGHWAAVWRGE